MRTLIFILTLLTAFQPISWAAGNCFSSQTGDSQLAISNLNINTPESGHPACSRMTGIVADTITPECLVNCLANCTSTACLEFSVTSYKASRSWTTYQPLPLFTYVLLNESPEIHPPPSAYIAHPTGFELAGPLKGISFCRIQN